ncbi:MAG TPA: MFS transporter [Candidatus Sulfotelmatobacter sp.]|nr:MFS transporter [Candidatus Sulfotelmatobacter sp.]
MTPATPLSLRQTAIGVVALCFVLGMVMRGMQECFTVFLLPLSHAFGWDRAAVASIYSLAILSGGMTSPVAGLLFDRLGPKRLYAIGLATLGSGLSLAGFADRLWQFSLCLGVGVGFATACLGTVPHSALVSRWFRNRLSSATGVIYSSAGIGVLLLVPLSQALIGRFDWRGAYHALGLGVLLLLPLMLLLPWQRIADGHPDYAIVPRHGSTMHERWTLKRAVRHSGFWGLFCCFFFTSLGNTAISVQGVAILVDAGFAPQHAANAWGFTGMLTPLGMLGFAWLDDHLGRRFSVTLSYGLSIAAVSALAVLYQHPSDLLLALFVILFGSTLGSRGPLVATIATHLFRGADLGVIFGSIGVGGGLGGALGSFSGGLLHDWSHGYNLVFLWSFLALCCGGLPFWIVRPLARERD